jgi:hypothetical protein
LGGAQADTACRELREHGFVNYYGLQVASAGTYVDCAQPGDLAAGFTFRVWMNPKQRLVV